jgi:hypothetical protein
MTLFFKFGEELDHPDRVKALAFFFCHGYSFKSLSLWKKGVTN